MRMRPPTPQRRHLRGGTRLRWLLGAAVVLGLGLAVAWKAGVAARIESAGGLSKVSSLVVERLRKDGLVGTVEAIIARSTPVPSSTLTYSIYDAHRPDAPGRPAVESAEERAVLPEFRTTPGIPPAQLAPSRDGALRFDQWTRSHGDNHNSKFSALDQIRTDNVTQLEVAWVARTGEDIGDPTKLGMTVQTNPVVVGRTLYIGGFQHLRAIDAVSGALKWSTELPTPVARRGLLFVPDDEQTPASEARGRLFVPTSAGVYAVNAATGAVITTWGDQGKVGGELSLIAPVAMNGKLVVALARPAVEAYDLKTGKLAWSTPLLPRSETKGSTLYGGVPWAGMAGDVARGRVFVSTGNARPQMVGITRPGDNRHTCSVVALDVATGKIAWAHQEVHHELWDLDVPSPPTLTTIERGGQRVDVVATVTKVGNTLLLDRDSGRPIFDYRERRAPTSRIPGERTAPYQPALEWPQPFSKLVFERSDLSTLTPSAREAVLRKTEGAAMGFFEPPVLGGKVVAWGLQGGGEWPGAATDPRKGLLFVPSNELPWFVRVHYLNTQATPESVAKIPGHARYAEACASCHGDTGEGRYQTERQGDDHFPVLHGLTALRTREQLLSLPWFQQQHRAVKLPQAVDAATLQTVHGFLRQMDETADRARAFTITGFWQVLLDDQGRPGSNPPWGRLTAIDLNTGRHVWQVPFGEYEGLKDAQGQPVRGQRNHGGVIATAGGLLFATGTHDNRLRALDAATGRELWQFKLPAAGSTPPSTYAIDGVQYLVVVASGGQHVEFSGRSDQVIAFRLPAAARR